MIKLQPIQEQAVDKFYKNNGNLLVSLPTGLGKTVVAVYIINELYEENKDSKVLVCVPASIRFNIPDTIKKFKLDVKSEIVYDKNKLKDIYEKNNVIVISYNFLTMYLNELKDLHFDLIITDELHKAKNFTGKTFLSLWQLRLKCDKFLGLTASYLSNNLLEFLTLVALVSKEPSYIKAEKLFINREKLVNIDKFKTLVGKWVFIPNQENIDKNLTKKPPKPIQKVLNVEMTKEEYINYLYVLDKIPKDILVKLYNGTISASEIRNIQFWLMAAQQVLLSPDYIFIRDINQVRPSTKVTYAAMKIKNSKEKTIVFTPFTMYGVTIVNKTLNDMGVKSKIYSGDTSSTERETMINDFENGDLQVICLTTAGAEGLNLPACKNIYFLSLHFNPEMLVQVMGRALRITSQNPEVYIYYVLSHYQNNQTIDYYMLNIIQKKKLLKSAVESILGENTIEEDGMASAGLTGYSSYEPVGFVKNKNKNKKGVFTVVYPK